MVEPPSVGVRIGTLAVNVEEGADWRRRRTLYDEMQRVMWDMSLPQFNGDAGIVYQRIGRVTMAQHGEVKKAWSLSESGNTEL